MSDTGNYCCFFCPKRDQAEKSLTDLCPGCGRRYDFPLLNSPERILVYRIIKPLNRGFFGATYVVETETGLVRRKYVLKITPVAFYAFFNKTPFEEEVALHHELSQTASHVVRIVDGYENQTITFSDVEGTKLDCHVTALDFVDGSPLKEYVSGSRHASAPEISQIAIDLLRMRSEFEAKELNHNDLHTENLIVENLKSETRRPHAVCDTIKLMAIDLGSLSDESKSNETRLGDVGFITSHVESLLDEFLKDPSDDRDYRIALALQGVTQGLRPQAQNLRTPNYEDLIQKIQDAYNRASHPWRPWNESLKLRGVGDHYNAQTLESWHVPQLLVDPDNHWVQEITKPGPQIVTGMRGCGKTMLLRSLDIHARAARKDNEDSDSIISRIRTDQYVGLFVSAQKLLDLRPQSLHTLEHRLSRLFINYALQAARALLHLKDVDTATISVGAHSRLAHAIADYLLGAENLRQVLTLEDLERQLTNTLVRVGREPERFPVSAAPAEAFVHLASEFRSCADPIGSSTIFYLFDDVSTRYLEVNRIEELLSGLMFQSPICAFKLTSEWQTIELGLTSPGRAHLVRENRDLTVFDLGTDVFETINAPGNKGKQFVSSILEQRAELHVLHTRNMTPSDILGDITLEQIAKEIASSKETSGERKKVYRGLACLTNVCVGDIGDIIKLYEEILRRSRPSQVIPIPQKIQSECFLSLSSRRLYELNRRKGYFKDHALAFAKAAHELLVRSYKKGNSRTGSRLRLRQYSSIYVLVTSDDATKRAEQIDRLRELIDSGVFVYSGSAPRAKTKDFNTIQQFILSFRKIYGISSFIGLADRDRFELSGDELEKWLENPSSAKNILLRNQIKGEVEDLGEGEPFHPDDSWHEDSPKNTGGVTAKSLAPEVSKSDLTSSVGYIGDLFDQLKRHQTADRHRMKNLVRSHSMWRSLKSAKDVCQASQSKYCLRGLVSKIVPWPRIGSSRHMQLPKRYKHFGIPRKVMLKRYWVCGLPPASEISVIDYTNTRLIYPRMGRACSYRCIGAHKAHNFQICETGVGKMWPCFDLSRRCGKALPLAEDLSDLFAAKESIIRQSFLESLSEILTGERGPYSVMKLIEENSDPSRNRALLAFGSPKHERLFTLLDQRAFDHIEVLISDSASPRARVAAFAAEFVCHNYPNANMKKLAMQDLKGLIMHLDERFLDIFDRAGANLELGLTGSKTQAVAAAVLASLRKVAQAWYVEPKEFDEKRFSTGVGQIRVFDIRVLRKDSVRWKFCAESMVGMTFPPI